MSVMSVTQEEAVPPVGMENGHKMAAVTVSIMVQECNRSDVSV